MKRILTVTLRAVVLVDCIQIDDGVVVEKVLAGALRRDMALKGSYKYDEADMLKHYLANKASHVLHQKVFTLLKMKLIG
ncbi:hypothetical protein HanHA300_Chr16g0620721 [Helianthus annuus]|nr:hypothetical protein HanHA300_Chr16g0620721 [Helianthus annuus]KAJ0461390.1 hypothetical protein HanHA89_Chr16g0671681 [Helianthus annuus]KAJ0641814.1 hypothetical protein HanLR1_Chr16g0631341 [Helianthus annuus]KAJ0645689.1 hypothetical protein HanOQP8_Chr16g0626671 [Helianthus annuus]